MLTFRELLRLPTSRFNLSRLLHRQLLTPTFQELLHLPTSQYAELAPAAPAGKSQCSRTIVARGAYSRSRLEILTFKYKLSRRAKDRCQVELSTSLVRGAPPQLKPSSLCTDTSAEHLAEINFRRATCAVQFEDRCRAICPQQLAESNLRAAALKNAACADHLREKSCSASCAKRVALSRIALSRLAQSQPAQSQLQRVNRERCLAQSQVSQSQLAQSLQEPASQKLWPSIVGHVLCRHACRIDVKAVSAAGRALREKCFRANRRT